MKEPTEIKEGEVIEFKTLTWNDGWEFECPCLMISPVIRCWEQQMSHEMMVESVMIDAICDGKLKGEDFGEAWGWRGYKLPVLKRRWREAMAGKKFPIANYIAHASKVAVSRDSDGELTWKDL